MYDEQTRVKDMECAREDMISHLELMRHSGVELFVDGKKALPDEAAHKTVRENSPYMADYVLDDTGIIRQVRFDRVTRR